MIPSHTQPFFRSENGGGVNGYDIMMPGIDGQKALSEIRRIERERHVAKEAVIIMVTAEDEPQDVLKAFYRGGCDDYLIKPIKQEDLLKKLREYNLI